MSDAALTANSGSPLPQDRFAAELRALGRSASSPCSSLLPGNYCRR